MKTHINRVWRNNGTEPRRALHSHCIFKTKVFTIQILVSRQKSLFLLKFDDVFLQYTVYKGNVKFKLKIKQTFTENHFNHKFKFQSQASSSTLSIFGWGRDKCVHIYSTVLFWQVYINKISSCQNIYLHKGRLTTLYTNSGIYQSQS